MGGGSSGVGRSMTGTSRPRSRVPGSGLGGPFGEGIQVTCGWRCWSTEIQARIKPSRASLGSGLTHMPRRLEGR